MRAAANSWWSALWSFTIFNQNHIVWARPNLLILDVFVFRLLKNLTSTKLAARDSADVRTRRHKGKNLKYKNNDKMVFSGQPTTEEVLPGAINGCVEEGGVSAGTEECVEECLDSLMFEGTL